jgi:hypothetical protein
MMTHYRHLSEIKCFCNSKYNRFHFILFFQVLKFTNGHPPIVIILERIQISKLVLFQLLHDPSRCHNYDLLRFILNLVAELLC